MNQPKDILKRYLLKQVNTELNRELKRHDGGKDIILTLLGEILNDSELIRIKGMLINVYGITNSQYNLLIWELLGTNNYKQEFSEWLLKDAKKGELELDWGLVNVLRFKLNRGILEWVTIKTPVK